MKLMVADVMEQGGQFNDKGIYRLLFTESPGILAHPVNVPPIMAAPFATELGFYILFCLCENFRSIDHVASAICVPVCSIL
jgi:hypothetical protein